VYGNRLVLSAQAVTLQLASVRRSEIHQQSTGNTATSPVQSRLAHIVSSMIK